MAKKDYEIKKVESNVEKGKTFTVNFDRFNKAKKAECYFECLWIVYSLIEDRTSAFLYYLGFTNKINRNKVTGSKLIKQEIRIITKMKDDDTRYDFDKLSGKVKRIEEVIKWCKDDDVKTEYQSILKKSVNKVLEDDEFELKLKYLQNEWREKRNQLTHALMVKDTMSVYSELIPLVEEGIKIVRTIDKAVNKLKKYKIREKYNIQ